MQRWKTSLLDFRTWSVTRTLRVASVIGLFSDGTQKRIREAMAVSSSPPAPISAPVPASSTAPYTSRSTPAPPKVPLFRLYSESSPARTHLYTTSAPECDRAVKTGGYTFEGVACLVRPSSAPGLRPLYRVYGDHGDPVQTELTGDDYVALTGHAHEGVVCYVHADAQEGTVPLYRLWNAEARDHLYTTNGAERERCLKGGWTDEGIVGHVYAI